MEELTGIAGADTIGKNLYDVLYRLLPPEKKTSENLEAIRQQVMSPFGGEGTERPGRAVHEILCPDNSVRAVEYYMVAIPSGTAKVGVAIFHDVTGYRRSAEEAAEFTRKLNQVSSVSRHDINNQLTIINGYLALLETGTPSMKTGDIIAILDRASGKIQRILKFTRDYQEIRSKPAGWQGIGETLRIAQTLVVPGTARIVCSETCARAGVFCDPSLPKVFANLIENSLRHGEKVSEITIGCRQEDRRLVIVYEDNGTGIPAKTRAVLFGCGKGKDTGYGLFLAREILAVTGISIAETGEPGSGARFEIVVPDGMYRLPPA
jgi:signal transduction histidine kinase